MTRNEKLVRIVATTFVASCLVSRAGAQGFDSLTSTPIGGVGVSYLVAADFDGDGDVDVAASRFVTGVGNEVALYPNLGAGEFGAPVQLASGVNGRLAAADFDGDGDVDLATNTSGSIRVHVNTGTLPFLSLPPIPSTLGSFHGLEAADLDFDGDVDLFAMGTGSFAWDGHFIQNQGGNTFQAVSFNAVASVNTSYGIGDLDFDGDAELALADAGSIDVVVYRKGGPFLYQYWTSLTGASDPDLVAVGDLDGDLDVDVVTTNAFGVSFTVWHNLAGTGFGAASTIPLGAQAVALVVADLDRDGKSEIVVGLGTAIQVWAEGSPGSFTIAGSASMSGFGDLRVVDLDRDSDLDLLSSNWPSSSFRAARNARFAGRVVCAGDGSATSCPCSNFSPAQSGWGCATSGTFGGSLRASGAATLADDALVLAATFMPAGTLALFTQGSALVSGGNGAMFGDGLLCTGGSIIRLAIKPAPIGSAIFPEAGDATVHTAGGVVAPAESVYQVWFRDAASFCTANTFNLTNGLSLAWRP